MFLFNLLNRRTVCICRTTFNCRYCAFFTCRKQIIHDKVKIKVYVQPKYIDLGCMYTIQTVYIRKLLKNDSFELKIIFNEIK